MLTLIRKCLRSQRGAETVEWIIVAILLALTGAAVFGPGAGGPLFDALVSGVGNIASIITSQGAAAP